MALSPARVSSRVEVALEPDGPTKLSIFSLGDGIGISFRDRSELRQADEVLRESQAQISALADNLPLGMVYQMDNGVGYEHRRFVYVSASCERLNGIAGGASLRGSPSPVRPDPSRTPRPRLQEAARRTPGGSAFDMEFAIRHAKTGESAGSASSMHRAYCRTARWCGTGSRSTSRITRPPKIICNFS